MIPVSSSVGHFRRATGAANLRRNTLPVPNNIDVSVCRNQRASEPNVLIRSQSRANLAPQVTVVIDSIPLTQAPSNNNEQQEPRTPQSTASGEQNLPDVICLSPDSVMMDHCPAIFGNRKIDAISASIDFEMKVDIIRLMELLYFNVCLFIFQVDGSRLYTIDRRKYSIPAFLVNTLQAWNTVPEHYTSVDIDRKFVEALLVCFIGKRNLISGNINRKLLRFVRDLYRFRVQTADRLEKFDEYFVNKRNALSK